MIIAKAKRSSPLISNLQKERAIEIEKIEIKKEKLAIFELSYALKALSFATEGLRESQKKIVIKHIKEAEKFIKIILKAINKDKRMIEKYANAKMIKLNLSNALKHLYTAMTSPIPVRTTQFFSVIEGNQAKVIFELLEDCAKELRAVSGILSKDIALHEYLIEKIEY